MPYCGQADKHALLQKVVFFAVLGNFMELIQGGGLCLCEEGAYETSCLGFTCQVRKEVCVCVCVYSLPYSSCTFHVIVIQVKWNNPL